MQTTSAFGPLSSRARVCLVAVWALLGFSSAAFAQSSWWEGITGFGSPNYSGRSQPSDYSPPKQEVLNDLRPNEVPWRSDEMLIAIDKAIERYQDIAGRGGWPVVPGNRMLRVGDEDDRVVALRRRLRATGELAPNASVSDYTFDAGLEAAVIRFQERNGLRATGRVDKPTIAALNLSADQRLQQLKLNRQRIVDLMQQPPEDRYVLVNVPAFQVEAVERYQVVQRHRVIVGRPERETPSLKAMIKAINFFPYWRVPDSVAQLDLIPRLRKEPEYLQKEQIRVIQGDFHGPEIDPSMVDWTTADARFIKFRQDPGPQNALGLLRIDMQNEHGVYMHDTPMKPLFQQRSRPFSAGCVRVQDVWDLAEWIASREPGWEQPGRVKSVLDQGQALDLTLSRPVPVYFTYITAWAEPDGRIEFRPDIYNRDGAPTVPGATADADPDAPPAPTQSLAP